MRRSAGGASFILSVFGRIGEVVAQFGDYSASLVSNNSNLPGKSVADALNNLSGGSSTLTTASFVQPAADATVAVSVSATAGFVVGQSVRVPSAPGNGGAHTTNAGGSAGGDGDNGVNGMGGGGGSGGGGGGADTTTGKVGFKGGKGGDGSDARYTLIGRMVL